MIILNAPFQPKSNISYETLKRKSGFYKPKDRVSILTISGCLLFIAQLISLILFNILKETGTSFWFILSTRILLTDGCVYLIVFLFKRENINNQDVTMLSPITPSNPNSSSLTLTSNRTICCNDSPTTIHSSSMILNSGIDINESLTTENSLINKSVIDIFNDSNVSIMNLFKDSNKPTINTDIGINTSNINNFTSPMTTKNISI
ncbi:hypothetical protein BCR32DRAFT_240109 [Anaeromyces robustus]|uniref:Uncharacterized protein n=1 Tax=Anaeromyces robustus TaxID=1754192 RepID=A0A1Y1XNW0_9FUNG|nr:hypothetical protein BCR32DRAFT_240109 [Anaeromyces robustus]|eukprot:ORX87440.1 hypothetical protein BCR32DRAFT_240109 [Anaeromyces robustus]